MIHQPILTTSRLILRPLALADATEVQRLCGAREIASTTLSIPHPYEDGIAEQWISTHPAHLEEESGVVFAITQRDPVALCGAIGLELRRQHGRAEMGYWIGVPYWNNGYCTEAATAVLRYGFEELALHRIVAMHLSRNPASGRVMQKIGMHHEGHLRQHVLKWDVFEDIEYYGVLADEWVARVVSSEREGVP